MHPHPRATFREETDRLDQSVASQRSTTRRQHEDIFSAAQSNLNHILIPNLIIPAILHRFPIQPGPIRALQINNIRAHNIRPIAKLIHLDAVPELHNRMLLTHTRVLGVHVRHSGFPAQQPATLRVQGYFVDDVVALEDVELPFLRGGRFPRFGGLVVFENDFCAGDGVGFFGEEARGFEVWFFLFGGFVQGAS